MKTVYLQHHHTPLILYQKVPLDYFEDGDNGVNYPYLNDAHYPYLNLEFKIDPIMFGYSSSSINVVSEFVDVCE